jgi:hypothetical protein
MKVLTFVLQPIWAIIMLIIFMYRNYSQYPDNLQALTKYLVHSKDFNNWVLKVAIEAILLVLYYIYQTLSMTFYQLCQ